MKPNYGAKFVLERRKKLNPYRLHDLHPTATQITPDILQRPHHHQQHHPSHPRKTLNTLDLSNDPPFIKQSPKRNPITIEIFRILRLKSLCLSVEHVMNLSVVVRSPLKTVSFLDDTINIVSVVQHVKSHLKRQVFMSSRIDRIVNNIIMNSIILLVPNVAKVSKDNVYNLKMLQFDILIVLHVMYFPLKNLC